MQDNIVIIYKDEETDEKYEVKKDIFNNLLDSSNDVLYVQNDTVNSNGNWNNDGKWEVIKVTSGKNITNGLFNSNIIVLFEQENTVRMTTIITVKQIK